MASFSLRDQIQRSSSLAEIPISRQIRATRRKIQSLPGPRSFTRNDIRNIPGVIVKDEIQNTHLTRDLLSTAENSIKNSIRKPGRASEMFLKNTVADTKNRNSFRSAVMKSPLLRAAQINPEEKLSLKPQVPRQKEMKLRPTGKLSLQSQLPHRKDRLKQSARKINRMPSLTESDESESE